MSVQVELVVYVGLLIGLYFYSGKRDSSGFFWAVCYFCLHWFFSETLGFGVMEVAIVAAIGLVAILEVTRYYWDDPFSTPSLIGYVRFTLSLVKKVVMAVGLQPKSTVYQLNELAEVTLLRKYLSEGRWIEAENFLTEFDTDGRSAIIDPLVSEEGRSEYYDAWLKERPDSAIAWMVSGFQNIHWAWDARGGGTADIVTNVGMQLFYSRLNEAHDAFGRSVNLDSQYADPYVGLMTVAMGTGWEREQLWDYFAKALVRSRYCYSAHSQMIHAVAEKWGGEPGEMFSIASKAVVSAVNDTPLVGILAEAHIEQWLYLGMCEQDDEAEVYFRTTEVRQDLINAYEKMKGAKVDSYQMIQALNNFTFCFYMGGMNELAKEAMIRLEGRVLEHPWDYLDETLMSWIDVGFAIDEVVKKLGVVTSDLPDVIAVSKSSSDNVPDDYFNRRVFKAPLIIPVSVAMVLVLMLGYPLLELLHKKVGFLDLLKPIMLELFVVSVIGKWSLVVLAKNKLKAFLYRYPIINSREALEALKPIVRTNMYTTLVAFLFLGVGTLSGIMSLLNEGIITRVVVLIMMFGTSFVFAYYSRLEERVKQIECNDENLEKELRRIFDCWMHKAFPDF